MHKSAVIVVNWDGMEYLGDCLSSIFAQSSPNILIVVDNGSTDGSLDYLKELQRSEKIKLIENDKNLGFATAINQGIEMAKSLGAEFVALLNNDAVADKNWLINMQNLINSDETIGAVSSKMINSESGLIDSVAEKYSIWGLPYPVGRGEKPDQKFSQEISAVSGGASLFRMKMLDDVGLFDGRFFAYYEDVDLSYRALLKGWSARFCPEATVVHKTGATSQKIPGFTKYQATKNFYYLYLKLMPVKLFCKYLPKFLASGFFKFLGSIKNGWFLLWLKANFVAFINLPGALIERHRIQSSRTISVTEFEKKLDKNLPPQEKSMRRFFGL